MPSAGETHDITLKAGATTFGFMVAPGEYNTERVDDFAPRIATGTEAEYGKASGTHGPRPALLKVSTNSHLPVTKGYTAATVIYSPLQTKT